MSFRGLILSIAGVLGCAAALSAQSIPVFPSCLSFGGVITGSSGCPVGSSFSYDFGALFDLDALVSIFNGSPDGITFAYSFSVTSGTLPPGISVTPSGLISGTFTQSGTYDFTISLSYTFKIPSIGYDESYSFPFSFGLNVTGYSGTQITIDPSNIKFNLAEGGTPAMQSVAIANHGGQAGQFSASVTTSSGGNWLSISSNSGSVAAYSSESLAITANPTNLQPGTYSGTVTVSITGAKPITVSVLAVVAGTQPNLALSQTGLFFDAVSGGSASSPQTIQVLNEGAGTLNYSASASAISGGSWLSVSSSSGSASASSPGSVTVSVNIAGLQAGTYYGKVTFTASGAADSPQFASVVLNLVSPANSPGGAVSPSGLIFVGSAGGTNPAAKAVTVSNPSPNALTYLATPFSNGNISWLNASPTSGSVSAGQPATVSVQPLLAGLAAGVYVGDLTVTFVSASSSAAQQVLHIEVLLIVLPAGVTTSSIRSGPQPHATTCTPTQLLPVFTLLGTGFNSTVGWPTAIEVTVVDDCGNPLLSGAGSVTVTFSSGDPALSLTSIGNGSWTGTWNAANASPGITITGQAQELKPALTGHASIGGMLAANAAVPSVSTGGIVSAANFVANQPLAPGAFGAIFGANLAKGLAGSNQFPLNTTLGDTSVVLNGEQLPLLFTSLNQINVILPYDVPVNSTQQLIVERGTSISIPQPVVIAAAVPAIFTQNGAGTGAALYNLYKSDGTPLPNNSPVSAGDVIVLYGSGLGAVDPPVAAGAQAPLTTLSHTVNPVTVTIGGKQQTADFAGLAPGFASLYQVNVVVPSGLPSGTATVTMSVGDGQQSAPVTIAVQ